MQKITPFLWFDREAEEAALFYTSIFKDSRILSISHYSEAGAEASGMPVGEVMVVEFELQGQRFDAINGGPIFKFSPAVSFSVSCKDQEEVDYYWERLSEGGAKEAQQCGWLADKYGLSWQIVPTALGKLMSNGDAAQSERVMQAMLQMKKIDIAGLQEAYDSA